MKQQRGIALIAVLLLVALMVIISTEVMFRQDRYFARTESLVGWDQRYQYAMAAEVVALRALNDDLAQDRNHSVLTDDCVNDFWAVNLPPTPYENAWITASVQDLQGRFNLNSLVVQNGETFERNLTAYQRLVNLLQQLLESPREAELLASELSDWIDSNNLVDDIQGAEDGDYRWRRTPNIPIAHESEFRAIKSFRADSFKEPEYWGLFAALPVGTKLNDNTASSLVLDAYFADTVGDVGTKYVMEQREKGAIEDLAQLFANGPFGALDEEVQQELREAFSVRTDYFQVMVEVKTGQQSQRLVTRVQRKESGDIRVYSRQLVPRLMPMEPACNPFYYVQSEEEGSGVND